MATYRLIVSYRGTAYAGWQRQVNAPSVQAAIERALGELLGRPVAIGGAGRTDAGVHARGQAAHLVLAEPFATSGLVHGTNHRLPPDIRILAADRMGDGFDARRHARAKEYRYRLRREAVLSPLDAPFAVRAGADLDVAAMAAVAALLPGRHDFTAFAAAGGSHRQPWRRIFAAEWLESGPELVFRVVGDGFLRGMVRALVGTLVEVGSGRRDAGGFGELLTGRPRGAAGPTAPAHGLVLERVDYPSEWRPLPDAPGAAAEAAG